MKFHIVIEDTPKGVRLMARAETNGVQDHKPNSLSAMLTAELCLMVTKQQKLGSLVIEEGEVIVQH